MNLDRQLNPLPVPVAISARHVHLTPATLSLLFGPNYELKKFHDLSQPGQFAAEECVDLIGPHGSLEKVRILGPVRSYDQIEVSMSDQRVLGIHAPVRLSGQVANTPGITMRGPKGCVDLAGGVILAHRHIHMSPADATQFGVIQNQSVDVLIKDPERELVFSDVIIRIDADFKLEMHVDTDEGNAAGIEAHSVGYIVQA
jgi:acetate kinase